MWRAGVACVLLVVAIGSLGGPSGLWWLLLPAGFLIVRARVLDTRRRRDEADIRAALSGGDLPGGDG